MGLLIGPFSLFDSLIIYGTATLVPGTNMFTFDENGIGWNLLLMAVGGVFFMGICLLKDHMLFDLFIYKFLTMKRKLPLIGQGMDSDVMIETERIRKMSPTDIGNGNLVLNGLTKYYGSHLAVNQLHLAVGGAECFGLLGINGAGKTTTFKMMTGDEMISSGDAFIRGFSMRKQMNKVHQMIGYCPQFDALLMDLTGRETLKIFALLRGIPRSSIGELSNKFAVELGFSQHLDKKVSAYSGGNKRKLSTALALIGDPSLIFLDEPTTGMDPGAKRQLWNIINHTRNSGRSVVMTSHSMEECEALCTKLAIMVNGEFKCLGSTQHLKNKFSKGFILTVKAGREDDETMEDIKTRINRLFPSSELKERYMDISTFHITDNLKWSEIFEMMANTKSEIGLSDYALTQTSLEQVFLFFTKSGLYQSKKTE